MKDDQWISTHDRLPEDEENVLVFVSYYDGEILDIQVAQLTTQKRGSGIPKFWVNRHGRGAFSKPKKDRVTHWQPLPKDPAGQDF